MFALEEYRSWFLVSILWRSSLQKKIQISIAVFEARRKHQKLEKVLKESMEDAGQNVWTKRYEIARSLIQQTHGADYALFEVARDGNCLYEAVAMCNDSGHTWATLKQVHHFVTVSMLKCVVLFLVTCL